MLRALARRVGACGPISAAREVRQWANTLLGSGHCTLERRAAASGLLGSAGSAGRAGDLCSSGMFAPALGNVQQLPRTNCTCAAITIRYRVAAASVNQVALRLEIELMPDEMHALPGKTRSGGGIKAMQRVQVEGRMLHHSSTCQMVEPSGQDGASVGSRLAAAKGRWWLHSAPPCWSSHQLRAPAVAPPPAQPRCQLHSACLKHLCSFAAVCAVVCSSLFAAAAAAAAAVSLASLPAGAAWRGVRLHSAGLGRCRGLRWHSCLCSSRWRVSCWRVSRVCRARRCAGAKCEQWLRPASAAPWEAMRYGTAGSLGLPQHIQPNACRPAAHLAAAAASRAGDGRLARAWALMG